MPILVTKGKKVVKQVRLWTRGPVLYHGRYGAVFEGIDNDSVGKEKIAVKSVPMRYHKGIHSLTNERKMLEKLSECPLTVQFLGTSISTHVDEFGNKRTMGLFLEYMPKGDLHRLLLSCVGQKLSEGVCKSFVRDLFHALSYMHGLGIVHGNINGSNALVGHRNVKLCDFGLSWDVKLKIPKWVTDGHKRLEHQQKVPESFLVNPKLGPPMDIFSLGCLVCEMLMGRRPRLYDCSNLGFEGSRVQEPKPSSNLTVGIPKNRWADIPDAYDFVTRCLIKEPTLRWTADQLRRHPWVEDVDDLMIVINMNRFHTLGFRAKDEATDHVIYHFQDV